MLPVSDAGFSPAHLLAFRRYVQAGYKLKTLSDGDLEALLEDTDFRSDVEQERRQRVSLRPTADAFRATTDPALTLTQHVRQLAAVAPAITVKTIDDTSRAARFVGKGMCYASSREIIIRDVTGPASYAIALHELGHLREIKQSGEQLEREVAAWQWAYDAALVWTAESEIQLDLGLMSHLDASTNARAIVAAEVFLKTPRRWKQP